MSAHKGKILIVDDEESIRRLLYQALEREGYSCVLASNGQEALKQASEQEIELALLDVKMPGMSGLEVLAKLNEGHPDTSTVMVTAMIDTATAVNAMKLGAYDYVTKPFDLGDLLIKVERALERRRLVLENRNYRLHLEEMVQRQAKQIREQFRELVQALAREETALREIGTLRRSKGLDPTSLPKDLRKPTNSVEEFAMELLRLIDTQFPPTKAGSKKTAYSG